MLIALITGGLLGASLAMAQTNSFQLPIANGPFTGTTESLTNYSCPDWFRDAKFGIWAHWGPQAVPMEGDWYARKMYFQGDHDYKDHLERYGHPSVSGFMSTLRRIRAPPASSSMPGCRWDMPAAVTRRVLRNTGRSRFIP